jgi:hypothetical protein
MCVFIQRQLAAAPRASRNATVFAWTLTPIQITAGAADTSVQQVTNV